MHDSSQSRLEPRVQDRTWLLSLSDRVARVLAVFLVLVHAALMAIGIIGLAELLLPSTPWAPISNPAFPVPILWLEWLLLLAAGILFVFGYLLRWRYTPAAMAVAYGALAALCMIQTTWYLEGRMRYPLMVLEYLEYALILVFLFRSRYMRHRFRIARRPNLTSHHFSISF